jgi:hypothetical protein
MDMVDELRQDLGIKAFCTFMNGGNASRLGDPGFMEIMNDLRSILGEKFVTVMCDSVSARVQRPGYVENMKFWIDKLGRDNFTTFIVRNAQVIEDKRNNERLEEWYGRTGSKFHTFMYSGIGAIIMNDEINTIVTEWFGRLDLNHFSRIFGNRSVISHVVKKNKFGLLLQLYNRGGLNKSEDLYRLLRANGFKDVKELFNT